MTTTPLPEPRRGQPDHPAAWVPPPRAGDGPPKAGGLLGPSPWAGDPHPGQDTELFGAALGAGLRASDHSLRELATLVRDGGQQLSPASLSEWATGPTAPLLTESRQESLLSLERFLPVRPGRLLAAAERTARGRRRKDWETPQPRRWTLAEGPAGHRARLEDSGYTNRGRLALVERQEEYTVGPYRWPGGIKASCRLLALAPGIDRYVVVMTVDHRDPVAIVAGAGCALGDQRRIKDGRYTVLATELRLDRPLDPYDLYDLDFAVVPTRSRAGSRVPMPGCVRVPEPGCRRLGLLLRFAGEHPKQVWRVTRWDLATRKTPKPVTEEPAVPEADGSFDLTVPNPGEPVGWRWRWPGALEATTPALVGVR